MMNNSYGLVVWGPELVNYINYIDTSNTIDDRFVYYLINQTNLIVDPSTFPSAGYVALINSSGILVKDLAFSRAGQALVFSFTGNSTIIDVQIQDDYSGILLYNSHNNSILSNFLTGNWEGGIFLILSENNLISDNAVSSGNQYGILLVNSSSNIIRNNEISQITHDGVWVAGSSHNILFNNTLTENSYSAFELRYGSNNNTLIGNNIENNVIGIKIEDSSSNHIFHNSFIQNSVDATSTSLNLWNTSYPSGGNYWSGYDGVDLNNDGIGDSPHGVNSSPQTPPEKVQYDNYPLMGFFSSFNTTLGKFVNIVSNSTIDNFEYYESNSTIRMHVLNITSQTYGFVQICIPHTLMTEPYNITVDGVNPTYWNYTLFDNGTHRWIYFAYEHSTLEIIIVPEFPSLVLLPLLMTIALLGAVVGKRKFR